MRETVKLAEGRENVCVAAYHAHPEAAGLDAGAYSQSLRSAGAGTARTCHSRVWRSKARLA